MKAERLNDEGTTMSGAARVFRREALQLLG